VLVVSSVAFVTTIQQVNASISEREERCNSHHNNQLTGSVTRDAAVTASRIARC